jgi:hypothetical protein
MEVGAVWLRNAVVARGSHLIVGFLSVAGTSKLDECITEEESREKAS